MRTMLSLVIALGLAAPAFADPVQAPADGPLAASPIARRAPPRSCDEAGLRRASEAPARLARLGDLPPADMHLLVRRRVNGCSVQTIVVHDVEANITLRGGR
jgi:hypothetical protein